MLLLLPPPQHCPSPGYTLKHPKPCTYPPPNPPPGVLTKLDIMDRGTNALPALRNLVVPLRLGYTAVVNRSQADINSSKSMRDAKT